MKTRRSSNWSNEVGYPEHLRNLCKEKDVLIIPQFVPVYLTRRLDNLSPRLSTARKSKESKLTDKLGSVSVFGTSKDDFGCDDIQPPRVGIVYDPPDDRESPLAIICKNIYIEYSFIHAIGKSLKPYPTITCLKIENCCIGKEIAEALVLTLAEEPGKQITDLSLNGNEDIVPILPLFFSVSTGLRYLSLQRCGLDDKAIKLISEALAFADGRDPTVQVLNLSMNKIGNEGCLHLANALRTNRTLHSLYLAGNQIEDEGAKHLAEVLQKFPLSHEEVMVKRKRIFDQILKKREAAKRLADEIKTRGEAGRVGSKSSTKSTERYSTAIRKIRGPDGKIRCFTTRDKKRKSSLTKINSGEKFRGKSGNDVDARSLDANLEYSDIEKQVDLEIPQDKHPLVKDVCKADGELWCEGCWSLANINLAYNYLTSKSVMEFGKVLEYQADNFKAPKSGLVRIVLTPGNYIQELSSDFQMLEIGRKNRGATRDYS